MTQQPAIRLDNLTVCYDRHPAVHHLSGAFPDGSLTAIVGPNGAGKSTLLKAIMGMLPTTTGRIDHVALTRADIAYLPQQAQIDRQFPITVLDVVLLGHWQRIGMLGAVTAALREQANAALAAVGLADFGRRLIHSLSAGQFQRVLFARMLLQEARLILLDEPFTAIDARTTADLLEVVQSWHAERRTVIAVLHDLEQVRAHFPETLLLARSGIAWGRTAEVLTPTNLHRARQIAEDWDDSALLLCAVQP
ncbi:MAG: ABC transporter ATP-binding protein [Candidatus Competibacteraceae bacterium]|nr:MAG: ABC transporter ATP-binding protein [Candidatus Competibacteraceae bacterium]